MPVETMEIADGGGEKSWAYFKSSVSMARKTHAQMTNLMPYHFIIVKPSPASKALTHVRLLSLGMLPAETERTLLYADVPLNKEYVRGEEIQWKPAFESYEWASRSQTKPYSKEEELLRERKRLSAHGITNVELDIHQKTLLFPAAGSLYTLAISDIGLTPDNGPIEILTECEGSRMDPKVSPVAAELVAFVNNNDVWVTNLATHQELRLTNFNLSGAAGSRMAGVASYICQEEFDRYTGYWWQPKTKERGKNRICFEVVDESFVEVIHVKNSLRECIDSYRYPKPGQVNANVSLRIVEFDSDSQGAFGSWRVLRMSRSLKGLVPWMEYIVRVDWIPSGDGVWAWVLDRSQTQGAVVYLRENMFDVVEYENGVKCDPPLMPSVSPSLDYRIIYDEKNQFWINVHDTFHFLESESDEEINFIWANESSGHRHLYHITTKPFDCCNSTPVATVTPLTSGEWEVSDQSGELWVDEREKVVYFMGLKDTPLESNLYRKSYVVNDEVKRVTSVGNSHTVTLSQDFRHAVIVSSNLADVSSVKLYSLRQESLDDRIDLLPPLRASMIYRTPEIFTFNNSKGDQLYGCIHRPPNMEPGRKYPTVLYVYGGPHVQLVTNAFKVFKNHRLYTLSKMGYVVVIVDGRGSARRGIRFESILKNKMGQVEISDQVEGLEYVDKTYGCIDMKRIAIHGWSYGGYLSLMGLIQRPDIFKIAISGAPVVRWEDYDTAYTERYMSLPDTNPNGYFHGSVVSKMSRFPDQTHRLLLVHGLIDENVHFTHTAKLIQELIKSCKPYDLMVYPSERHGIRNGSANEHFEVFVLDYLHKYL